MVIRILLLLIAATGLVLSQPYPDQHYFYEKEKLIEQIESMDGMVISSNGKSILLSEGLTDGYVIFKVDSSEFPFNRGLPSWNGHVPNDHSSFKVMMRFYSPAGGTGNGWSPWLTVGFWKANIWSSYGRVSYGGGEIEIDYAVLNSYHTKWQFMVEMKRTSIIEPSPSLHKLSFFISDQVTTNNVNIASLVNEKPEAIFIDTKHIWQNSLDPEEGGNMCSPTSVSMVLYSYGIEVNAPQFAWDTYCPYWEIFGIWPRVVQNAAEFGLNGAVTRYRTWSQAREVLAAGGRVVISVGSPLYPNGHLIMLAGFDSTGNPITHDPAKSNGYSYKHSKTLLSQSWFNKGGIAYTLFPEDTSGLVPVETISSVQPESPYLFVNYPNPFNSQTNIKFETPQTGYTSITVYDISGSEVQRLYNEVIEAGSHIFSWNTADLPSGNYFIQVLSGNYSKTIKAVLLK